MRGWMGAIKARRFWLVTLATAASAVGLMAPGTAFADTSTPVNVSGEALRQDLFVAGAVARLGNGIDATRDVVLQKVLQALYAHNPGLAPSVAANDVDTLKSAFDSAVGAQSATLAQETSDQQIVSVLNMFEQAPVGSDVRTAIQDVASQALQGTLSSGGFQGSDSSGALFTSADQIPTLQTGDFNPATVLRGAIGLATGNSSFGQAWNQVFSGQTGENVNDSISTLVSGAPGLQGNLVKSITKFITGGGFSSSEGDLTNYDTSAPSVGENLLGAIDTTTQDAQTTGEALQSGSESPADAAAAAAGDTATLDDASGAVSLLSNLVGAADPQAGKDIQAFGTAVIDIADAFSQWSDSAETALNVASSLGDLGGAVLSGNVVQGVMSLVSLFGSSGPSPDQLILQQLGALKQDLDNFEQKVSERLNQIDQQIASVYTGLTDQLHQIQVALSSVSWNVTKIESGLSQLQHQLDQVEHTLYNAIVSVDWNAKVDEIRRTLTAVQVAPLDANTFYNDSQDFFNWATGDAYASPNVLGPPSSMSLTGVDLNQVDLDINVFDTLPVLGGWQPTYLDGSQGPQPTGLPNPHDWSLASRAFSELLAQYPQYVALHKSFYQSELAQLKSEGQQLSGALANISANDASSGTHNAVLNALITNYQNAGTAMVSVLTQAEGNYRASLSGQFPKITDTGLNTDWPIRADGSPIDPWGGPNQSLTGSDLPQTSSIATVGTGCAAGRSTSDVFGHLSPAFLLAVRLGKGSLSNSCSASWTLVGPGVSTTRPSGTAQPPIKYITDCKPFPEYGNLNVTLSWSYTPNGGSPVPAGSFSWTSGKQVESVSYVSANGTPCPPDSFNDPGLTAGTEWSSAEPGLGGATFAVDSAGLSTAQADVTSYLSNAQRQIYSWIAKTGSGAAGNLTDSFGLGAAADNLMQATSLIDDYVSLGLGPALKHDDALHALLFGGTNNRLMNGSDVRATYGQLTQLGATLPASDPVGAMPNTFSSGADLLTGLLCSYVTGSSPCGSSGTAAHASLVAPASGTATGIPEDNPLVSATIDRLSLADSIVAYGVQALSTLNVSLAGAGSGTVTSAPAGINCGPTCSATFPQGSTVTLTAVPDSGSTFAGWTGGGCSGTGPCTVPLGSDTGVTATFGQTSSPPSPSSPSSPPQPAPAQHQAAPACTLHPVSGSVLLKAPHVKHRHGQAGSSAPLGTLTVVAQCDQAAAGVLRGTVTEILPGQPVKGAGKHRHPGSRRGVAMYAGPISVSLTAGHAANVMLHLPAGALNGLSKHRVETVVLALTATNGNGTGRTTASIASLHGIG